MQYLNIITVISPIFLLVLTGFILKNNLFKEKGSLRCCEQLTYYLLFPSFLINFLSTTELHFGDMFNVAVIVIVSTLIVSCLLLIWQKYFTTNGKEFSSYFQGSIRYNSYIYVGVAMGLYGDDCLSILSVIIACMVIVTNILSVVILSIYASDKNINIYKTLISNISKNPFIIAILLGLAINLLGVKVNSVASKYLSVLGNAAMPVSLLCIGASLNINFMLAKWKNILSISAVKLILLPLVTICLLIIFEVDGLMANLAVLYSCIPCASNAYNLAKEMGGDVELIAGVITASTIFSIASMTFFSQIVI